MKKKVGLLIDGTECVMDGWHYRNRVRIYICPGATCPAMKLRIAACDLLEAAKAVLLAEADGWREPSRSTALSLTRQAVDKAEGTRL